MAAVHQSTSVDHPVSVNPEPEKKTMYILWYRSGSNPHSLMACFFMPAAWSFQQVVARAKEHCIRMNIKFTFVQPFLYDFDQEEKKTFGGDQ